MTTRARVMKRADELGCIVDEPFGGRITIDAPDGRVFECSDLHTIVGDWTFGPKADAWKDLYERMGYGVGPCRDRPDCDACDH